MDESTKKIIGKIVNSIKIFFLVFMVPSMIIILILLGSLQARYSYESNFSADLNHSLGQVGGAVYRIYDVGNANPRWFYYSLILFAGFFIEAVYRIIDLFKVKEDKELNKSVNVADEDSNIVKGGNKVI